MTDTTYNAELSVQSDLIYLRSVRAFVRKLAEGVGFCRERLNDTELAVDEVFSNAVEHGSVSPRSPVMIRCFLTDELVSITVSDTGSRGEGNTGWPDTWSDIVRRGAQPGAERGNGLFLAYSVSDSMSIEPNSMGGVDVHLVVYRARPALAVE